MTTTTLEQFPPAANDLQNLEFRATKLPNSGPQKPGRKQHRSCDQCRKGKRGCDAVILKNAEKTRGSSSGEGSSRRGSYPLGPCSNCAKTGKDCTFVWLRSQDKIRPDNNSEPSLKRMKLGTSTAKSQSKTSTSTSRPLEQARSHLDFLSIPSPDLGSSLGPSSQREYGDNRDNPYLSDLPNANFSAGQYWDIQTPYMDHSDHPACSVWNESVNSNESADDTFPEDISNSTNSYLFSPSELPRTGKKPVGHVVKHGIRHLSRPTEISPFSIPDTLNNFTNKSLMTENLMKVYHDSLENALSCWLTERTCPYGTKTVPSDSTLSVDTSMLHEWGPDWSNRICGQVFNLDRASASIRDSPLTMDEDRAASKALNLAIMAFATQWSQSSERSRTKFPSNPSRRYTDGNSPTGEPNARKDPALGMEFDRMIQESLWSQARRAIQDATHIESFRVVFAHTIFALTQKPMSTESYLATLERKESRASPNAYHTDKPSVSEIHGRRKKYNGLAGTAEAVESHSKVADELEAIIHQDGPPVFLEQGLRHIHSLRCKLDSLKQKPKNRFGRAASKEGDSPCTKLTQQDWKTVDLLYWLCIMFDTLSSAMHTRPLVVSDEDSDIHPDNSNTNPDQFRDQLFDNGSHIGGGPEYGSSYPVTGATSNLWTSFFFKAQQPRGLSSPVRWPCSYEIAATTLADAAPIKVLLFRKVTRIQTLLWRHARRDELQVAINNALNVYRYWNTVYGPFITDCIAHHDQLPARVQSWYICLTGHWHLAVLLLADVIQSIEDQPGVETRRREDQLSGLITALRQSSTQDVAALARCSCPRADASFPEAGNFHFAVNQGALLTEPWTQVLIRVFAKAGALLLEEGMNSDDSIQSRREALQRSEECVEALFYLGRKSDMAFLAAQVLARALKSPLESMATESSSDPEDWIDCAFSAYGDFSYPAHNSEGSTSTHRAGEMGFGLSGSNQQATLSDFDLFETLV